MSSGPPSLIRRHVVICPGIQVPRFAATVRRFHKTNGCALPSNQWFPMTVQKLLVHPCLYLVFLLVLIRFLLHASSLQSGYTDEVNAIVFPSGDHFTKIPLRSIDASPHAPRRPPWTARTPASSLPRRQKRQRLSVRRPPRRRIMPALRKLHCLAPTSGNNPDVARPSIRVHVRGFATAYATHFPSGEIFGSPTRCIWIMSSNVMGCFAASCEKVIVAQHKSSPAATRPLRKTVRIMIVPFAFAGKFAVEDTRSWILSRSAQFPRPSGKNYRTIAHYAPTKGAVPSPRPKPIRRCNRNVAQHDGKFSPAHSRQQQPVKISATAANAVPPGNRKSSAPRLLPSQCGQSRRHSPVHKQPRDRRKVAFQRKSPEIENTSSRAANARIEICGVRNRDESPRKSREVPALSHRNVTRGVCSMFALK